MIIEWHFIVRHSEFSMKFLNYTVPLFGGQPLRIKASDMTTTDVMLVLVFLCVDDEGITYSGYWIEQ